MSLKKVLCEENLLSSKSLKMEIFQNCNLSPTDKRDFFISFVFVTSNSFRDVTVSGGDSESSNPSSNLTGTLLINYTN
jgi:hypothetical protein